MDSDKSKLDACRETGKNVLQAASNAAGAVLVLGKVKDELSDD